ncbi:hypothetical protein GCM10010399_76680 [Dactylosporangium fulvum]|uniref:GNAT family N-acetyltransferase n=1 Tax=Dactylosporangium fulvum TaxID=53359 RepID=A0ABY5W700_9ACTN|nr:hypothetical protein [Dactylosporangium fulvum]UWP85145.1 hypothetical protein Dfulv_13305 [Dactylosporangium fulvum]
MPAGWSVTTHDVAHLSGCDPRTALVFKDGSKFWRTEPDGSPAGTVLGDGAVVVISHAELVGVTTEADWVGEGWARELLPEAAARVAERLNAR